MTKADRAHMDRVASLGCLACRRIHGPHVPAEVELHHLRTGGWGRGSAKTVMGLCAEHHRGNFGIHGMGTRAFDRHYGDREIYGDRAFTQADLLADALELTGEMA